METNDYELDFNFYSFENEIDKNEKSNHYECRKNVIEIGIKIVIEAGGDRDRDREKKNLKNREEGTER